MASAIIVAAGDRTVLEAVEVRGATSAGEEHLRHRRHRGLSQAAIIVHVFLGSWSSKRIWEPLPSRRAESPDGLRSPSFPTLRRGSLERAGLSASKVVQSIGSGWEPPHRASVAQLAASVLFRAGLDAGMAF